MFRIGLLSQKLQKTLSLLLVIMLVNGLSASVVGVAVSHASVALAGYWSDHHHDEKHHHDYNQHNQYQKHNTHIAGTDHPHHDASDHMHEIPGQLLTALFIDVEITDTAVHQPAERDPVRAHYPFERPPQLSA